MKATYTDSIVQWLKSKWNEFKAPAISAWIAGALAYMFVITNKIVNWDDLQFLFGKGYTLTSGRWGLDIIQHILPNFSMPWLWGVFSIFLLSIAVCVIINIFEIKRKVLQCILAANVLVFPSQIGTMLYMFTCSSYAVAFLMAVLSVRMFVGGGTLASYPGYCDANSFVQHLSGVCGDCCQSFCFVVDSKGSCWRGIFC